MFHVSHTEVRWLSCLFRIRWCRVWAQTPRLLSSKDVTRVSQWQKDLKEVVAAPTTTVQTIDLIWVTRSIEWLTLMQEDLESMIKKASYQKPHLFRLHIFITSKAIENEKELSRILEGTELSTSSALIYLGRPDFNEEFLKIVDIHMSKIRQGNRIGVFVAGPYSLQVAAKRAYEETADYIHRETNGLGGNIQWHCEKFS